MHEDLVRLAALVRARNSLEVEITTLTSRPAALGHIGEYIASRIFNIALEDSASHKALDGRFTDGPIKGHSVNIKWYARREGVLDITPNSLPDYYLVLAGPRSAATTSRGRTRPWVIESVFLFGSGPLTRHLQERGVKLGVASSVAHSLWDQAEVFPSQTSTDFILSPQQRDHLALFQPE